MFFTHPKKYVSLYLPVIALFFVAFSAVSQDTTYSDNKLGISLSFPDSFTIEKKDSGDVIFIARPNQGYFPTVTVVQQIGNAKVADRTMSEIRNEVVDSYRAVGFVDAEAEYGEKRKLAGRDVFFGKILYVHNQRPVAAGVFVFPSKERYFILTMVNDRDALASTLPILEKIAKSVVLKYPPPDPEISANKVYIVYWFVGALALMLLLQGIWLLYLKFSKKN
jgi:hypothetical protein